MIKLVLFDWGDVCGFHNSVVFNEFLMTHGCDVLLVDDFFERFKSRFDRDEFSEEEFWSKMAQHIGFKEHWSLLAEINKERLMVNWSLLEYIKELRRNVNVVLLSNMDKTTIDAIRSKVKLVDYFDEVYFSSEMKTGKLEKSVINKIMQDFMVKPTEMLFVDDFPDNINKAEVFGMQTFLFGEMNDLKQKIAELFKR